MPATIDLARPVAVVCALEDELGHLRDAVELGDEEWHDGRVYWHATAFGLSLVLVRCGIGMVNAAAATEALLIHQQPAAVLNYGCTGAHREDLLPGDLVIGERVVAYDRVHIAPDGGEHYVQMHYLRHGADQRVDYVPADPALLIAAQEAARQLEGRHEPWPPLLGCPAEVSHRPPRVWTGTVASADRWNRSPARIRAIVTRRQSLCEDMEAAAIALVCAGHAVPFLARKDISNNELLRTTAMSTFMVETAGQLGRRAAALTLATLRVFAGAAQA